MKKLLLLIIILLLANPCNAKLGNYSCRALTGGSNESLDNIDGSGLQEGDVALTVTSDGVYIHRLNATSGAAESSPEIIAPDNNAGTKRWEMVYLKARDPASDDDVGDQAYNDQRHPLRTEYEYGFIFIPAGAFIPLDTNGAEFGTHEYTTNDIVQDYYAFDGTTEEYISVNVVVREQWDRSTIKSKFLWAPGSSTCTAGDTVEFEITGGAISDDDSIDAALGTSQVISDIVLSGKDGDLHSTSPTPSLTVGGTPAVGDLIHFKVSRNVSGTDDMTEDAWLFGVIIQYKKTETVTSW